MVKADRSLIDVKNCYPFLVKGGKHSPMLILHYEMGIFVAN